jgi:hypothetical protein
MKHYRIVSVAALVGILALGAAACGKSSNKSAGANPAASSPATSPTPTASAAPAASATPTANPRAAVCKKIEDTAMGLWGPLMEVGSAGNDSVKYKNGVQNLLKATDVISADLGRIAAETSDAEIVKAIATMIGDVQKLKQAVLQYNSDPRKLESVLNGGNFNTGSDMLEPLCAG